VGETLGTWPDDARLGPHYLRRRGAASRALELATRGAWWVDFAGITQIGDRPSTEVPAGAVQIVDFDPRLRVCTVHLDELVDVGAVLREGLDSPLEVRELEVDLSEDRAVVRAYVGTLERSAIVDPLRRVVEQLLAERLHGLYRYRVIRMSSDRVELQLVRARVGLPDALPISQWPGVAGVHAELAEGAEVLVAFIEGDPAQPIVAAYAGRDGAGWVPVSLDICGGTEAAARVNDEVEVTIPANSFLVAAQAGVMNPAPVTVTGRITSGSTRVVIG